MNKALLLMSLTIIFLYGHSGRTDSSGCHKNTKTGSYHCHNSGSSSSNSSIQIYEIPEEIDKVVEIIDSYNNLTIDWADNSKAYYYNIYTKNINSEIYLFEEKTYNSEYNYTDYKVDMIKVEACNILSECSSGKEINVSGYKVEKTACSNFEVVDGDTIKYNGTSYRLYGIDAPESFSSSKLFNDSSKCNIDELVIKNAGNIAKEYLKKILTDNNECTVEVKDIDSYGRKVVIIEGEQSGSINEKLIGDGYAIAWESYIEESSLKTLWTNSQSSANSYGLGLWTSFCSLLECISDTYGSCSNGSNIKYIQVSNYNNNLHYSIKDHSSAPLTNIETNMNSLETHMDNNGRVTVDNLLSMSNGQAGVEITIDENGTINSDFLILDSSTLIRKNLPNISQYGDVDIYIIQNSDESISIEYELELVDEIFKVEK